ncbi:MAG: hypothetical protein ACLP01_10345 [Solirubrobacteraceae bacterium]
MTERVRGLVVGYRAWRLKGYSLVPLVMSDATWRVEDNEAECRASHLRLTFRRSHAAPAKHCSCGLYAYHSAEALMMKVPGVDEEMVYGAVVAWGRMEVHRAGFRAQFGRPVALAFTERTPIEARRRHAAVAEELGLPYVAPGELQLEGEKHGSPVPRSQRPRWGWLDALMALGIACAVFLGITAGYGAASENPLDLIGVAICLAWATASVLLWRRHRRE